MNRRVWLVLLLVPLSALSIAEDRLIEEIEVRVRAVDSDYRDFLSGYSVIDEEALSRTRARHPNELFVRVPGVWISRGSGQEHLTALRSGVLSGAGACGSLLYLEDGVPIRPQGFCNVNNLFESTLELADAVEVLRGPAVAAFRGNPLYGAINAISSSSQEAPWLEVETGSESYRGLKGEAGGALGQHQVKLAAKLSATKGFREQVSHREQKLKLVDRVRIGHWSAMTTLALTNLDQQTGGYVLGGNAYRNSALRRGNPNPEAYREAWSARVASHWQRQTNTGAELTIAPYARRSRMQFLQHFLPGQPTESNGQTSIGAIAHWLRLGHQFETSVEAQFEWADTWLMEAQDGPTQGSPFLVETRPAGRHYDFDVNSLLSSLSARVVFAPSSTLEWETGLRAERLSYDYTNNWLAGNTRDDGSNCGFGGCLYTRPASREDSFTNLGGMLGLRIKIGEQGQFWMGAGSGFRPPQSTELYRLQRGQLIADLDSERRTSFELGARFSDEQISLAASAYAARSEDLIFRDAQGVNVSNGRTQSLGIEFEAELRTATLGRFELIGTWARHEYDFDQRVGGGETIESGNDVDTAPRFMGSGRWTMEWRESVRSELEVVYLGEYWMNANNTHQYAGHFLVNWRLDWQVNQDFLLFARITNLAGKDYAHRADFAFGNQRYFPGPGRQVYIGVRVQR